MPSVDSTSGSLVVTTEAIVAETQGHAGDRESKRNPKGFFTDQFEVRPLIT